jgi:hypothetical protein
MAVMEAAYCPLDVAGRQFDAREFPAPARRSQEPVL